jgi:hypothetical protein
METEPGFWVNLLNWPITAQIQTELSPSIKVATSIRRGFPDEDKKKRQTSLQAGKAMCSILPLCWVYISFSVSLVQ